MTCTNKQNPTCPNCNKSGLAILPVRYAVMPNYLEGTLPAPLGDRVTNVKLVRNKYVLKTLRQGFLYLLHEKHPRGSHIKWEVYSVSAAGTLWKQLSPNAIESITHEPTCARQGHNIPASIVAISSPEKCGTVWIAFSEHAWSKETLSAFEADAVLRDRRMQVFSPKMWIKTPRHPHGLHATRKNVEAVIEYQNLAPGPGLRRSFVESISQPDGLYNPGVLRRQSSRYPMQMRREQSTDVVALMNKVGEHSEGEIHPPIVLALWDPVGIVHELNGFRNDAAGYIKKYVDEREFELTALSAIDGVKKLLEARAAQTVQAQADIGKFHWTPEGSAAWLEGFAKRNPGSTVSRARQVDLCTRWEKDSANQIPTAVAKRREHGLNLAEAEWQSYMTRIDNEAAQWYMPKTSQGKTVANATRALQTRREKSAIAEAWPKYQKKLNPIAIEKFKDNYHLFLDAAAALIDSRTADNVAWIASKSLHDAITEFHPKNIEDGVAFEEAVGDMIFGITSSPAGASKIDEWVAEAKANETNLLWRAIAYNQEDGVIALNATLAAARAHTGIIATESAFDNARDSIKHLAKLADLEKKALSLHNSLRKPGVTRIRTGGIEKLLMTVGDRFFQPFVKKGIDACSGLFVHGLLLARAGGDYTRITGVLLAEAKFGRIGRTEALAALSKGHQTASSKANELRAKWADLAADADLPKQNAVPHLAGSFNEAKELRFGMVAVILQGMFLVKLAEDAENDPNNSKLLGELLAAKLSLSAGIVDLGATAIKGLHTAKDAAMSFQMLKIAGGTLSAGAAWVAVTNDVADAKQQRASKAYGIAALYGIKAIANFTGGITSLLTSLSYISPALQKLAQRCPTTMIGRAVNLMPRLASPVAIRLFAARAILMVVGLWASVAVIGIQILIYALSDDELEKWCARCAFGIDTSNRVSTTVLQMDSLENALVEVLS